eukprot:2167280-Rhodomonas_salina.2
MRNESVGLLVASGGPTPASDKAVVSGGVNDDDWDGRVPLFPSVKYPRAPKAGTAVEREWIFMEGGPLISADREYGRNYNGESQKLRALRTAESGDEGLSELHVQSSSTHRTY